MQSLSADGNMPQIAEGGMEHDVCFFDDAMTLLGGIVRLAQALLLSVPLLYGALVITVFRPWYLTHTALADGIFFVLVGLVALSWVVSLIRVVREAVLRLVRKG